jgi:hypothetical protein
MDRITAIGCTRLGCGVGKKCRTWSVCGPRQDQARVDLPKRGGRRLHFWELINLHRRLHVPNEPPRWPSIAQRLTSCLPSYTSPFLTLHLGTRVLASPAPIRGPKLSCTISCLLVHTKVRYSCPWEPNQRQFNQHGSCKHHGIASHRRHRKMLSA